MIDVVCSELSRSGISGAGGHGDDDPDNGDSDNDTPRRDDLTNHQDPARPPHGGGAMGGDGDDDPGDGGGNGPSLQ